MDLGEFMIKLVLIFIVALALSVASERYTKSVHIMGNHYAVRNDVALILLIGALSLFSGLRVEYNDTWNYINGFRQAPALSEFITNPENLNPFTNPLFYIYQSFLKQFTNNPQVLVFTTATFTQCCFVLFLKRYSHNFPFSIFLYFTLGTFCVSLAAIKQVVAMAILTLGFPNLEKKQWVRYYVIVFVAMLVHTYAISFILLPLFIKKPWKLFTYLFMATIVFLMLNFEDVITEFMEQANELGKTLENYEVFDSHTINNFRLAVYAVTPLLSWLFQKWIFRKTSSIDNALVHMSIISFAFLIMGTQAGANMFGRMAHYFEFGTICCLPWILKQTFDDRSYRLISAFAIVGFLFFFIYANGINGNFDQAYLFS